MNSQNKLHYNICVFICTPVHLLTRRAILQISAMCWLLLLISADRIYTFTQLHYRPFPITGRASSFLVFLEFSNTCGGGGGGKQNNINRPINLPKVITFSTDYTYTSIPPNPKKNCACSKTGILQDVLKLRQGF